MTNVNQFIIITGIIICVAAFYIGTLRERQKMINVLSENPEEMIAALQQVQIMNDKELGRIEIYVEIHNDQ